MKRLAAPVLCGMILFACAGPGLETASLGSVIHVVAGKTVTLSVEAGSEGCDRWRMVRLPPSRSLRLESKGIYSGLGGESRDQEAWTFLALEPGRFSVDLRCVPSEGQAPFPTARKSFLVVVHEDETAWAWTLEEVFAPVINRRLREMESPRAGKVNMRVVGIHGDLSRVDISSRNPASKAQAMVYLKRREGTWEVVGMGTHFDRSFYRTHDVPPELQGAMDAEAPYVPISGASCRSLMEAVSEVLGLEGRLEERVLFFGLGGREDGEACRITFEATGDLVPGTAEAAESIRCVLEDRGWSEEPAHRADGPLGTAAGFRKEAEVVLVRVIVEPGREAGLLSNRPLSVGDLLPEDRLYTIVIEGAKVMR